MSEIITYERAGGNTTHCARRSSLDCASGDGERGCGCTHVCVAVTGMGGEHRTRVLGDALASVIRWLTSRQHARVRLALPGELERVVGTYLARRGWPVEAVAEECCRLRAFVLGA